MPLTNDGYQYVINPKTGTTVNTTYGNAQILVDPASGLPYARNMDGSVVKNPETGNVRVFGPDGLKAVDKTTGNAIEIAANGRVVVMDKTTGAPMPEAGNRALPRRVPALSINGENQLYETPLARNPLTGKARCRRSPPPTLPLSRLS